MTAPEMTIQAAAAAINPKALSIDHPPAHASPQAVPGALAVLGYAVGALGLYAGSRAPLKLGRAVRLSLMEGVGGDGILHADIVVHGPTPELLSWMAAEGCTVRESGAGRNHRLRWETLTLTAYERGGEA